MSDLPAGIAQRIDLINEYGARGVSTSKVKQDSHHALTLSSPFGSQCGG